MSYKTFAVLIIVMSSLIEGSGLAQNSSVAGDSGSVLQVDHIIVFVADLQEGNRQIYEMTGVRTAFGGLHPGAGTQNSLMALGPRSYLEILAPHIDEDSLGTQDSLLAFDYLMPIGFAVSTTDIVGTIALLRNHGYVTSDPTSGSRLLPDGETLKWTTMGISDPAIIGAPFFIQWEASSPHPASTSPRGCTLLSLKVLSPQHDTLERLFSVLGLEVFVEYTVGQYPAFEILLDCPKGSVLVK